MLGPNGLLLHQKLPLFLTQLPKIDAVAAIQRQHRVPVQKVDGQDNKADSFAKGQQAEACTTVFRDGFQRQAFH